MARVHVADAEYASVAMRFSVAPTVISLTAGSNVSHATALPAGQYRVCSNVLAFVRQGASNTMTVLDTNAHPLVANLPEVINVSADADDYVNAYSAADGALWLSRR